MHKTLTIGGTAVVALAAGAIAASTLGTSANADTAPRNAANRASGVFNLVERAITDTTVDTGPKGDSRGDILAFANPVYSQGNQRRVGYDNGSCIRTVVAKAYECSWTLTLRHGSIVVEGPFYDTKNSVLAITGGTGSYADATGRMGLHARNAKGTAYDFRYRVSH